MDAYAQKYGTNAVRKNLTIPAYMNTYIEKNGLSLSKIAQDAISAKMQAWKNPRKRASPARVLFS